MQDSNEGVEELEGEGGDVDELRAELEEIQSSNDAYMQEHGLGIHPLAIPQTQIRVLVNMLCPDEDEKISFDILVQQTIRADMENAVADAERQRLNQQIQAGISTADVAAINEGRLPGGAVDLAGLRDQPRAVRRQAARQMARDALKKDGGGR